MIEVNEQFMIDAMAKSNYIKGPYGCRYGRLLVLYCDRKEPTNGGKGSIYFDMCQCDCGTKKVVRRQELYTGRIKSCGCLRKELIAERGRGTTKHGLSNHPLYGTYHTMISRCYSNKSTAYRYYGGRGITVCQRWRESFANFLADMGERPVGLTLDRINPDGNYEPGNVRWANLKTQQYNRSSSSNYQSHQFMWEGEIKTIPELSELSGIPYNVLYRRLVCGMDIEEAMSLPPNTRLSYTRRAGKGWNPEQM